jgi:Fe-S-cluster containining protein
MEQDNPWNGLCNKCKTITCCINFLTPTVTEKELKIIQKKSGFSDIAKTQLIDGKKMSVLKRKPNSLECMFLGTDKRCTINEYKPFDCIIFPFDIFKIDEKFTWVVYTCNPDLDWKWSETILKSFEENLLTPDIIKDLDAFASFERYEDAGEMYEHTVLRPVNLNAYKNKSAKKYECYSEEWKL